MLNRFIGMVDGAELFKKFLENGHVGAEGVTGTGDGGYGLLGNAIVEIGKTCKYINWIVEHPAETGKIIVISLCHGLQVIVLIICGGAVLMAILGHKQAIKWIPISVVTYILLKIVAVII